MITYNVVFNKGTDKGVYAISVVGRPSNGFRIYNTKQTRRNKTSSS